MHQSGGLSDTELGQIVCRASNLAERLAGDFIPSGGGEPLAPKRLARWKLLSANNDETFFRRRLEAYGLQDASAARLLALLGEVRRSADAALPAWAALLQEMTQAVSAAFSTGQSFGPRLSAATMRAVPFAQLYAPIIALARRKVETAEPPLAGQLSSEGWQGLQRHLLGRLSSICSLALQPKFLAFKAVRQTPFPFPLGKTKPPPPSQRRPNGSLYAAFVQEQGARGLSGFFAEYPAAARLAAQTVLQWIEFVTEFLRRLEADRPALAERFGGSEPLGEVQAVKAGLSDPHRGGRSVLILQFERGLRLVYKPRPMQIDAAFFDLLEWFNAHSGLPPLRRLGILTREDYGWEECVEHLPCATQSAARRFYRRAGVLLCLIHALRGTDFHCENLIASAEHPVAVDLEALCHPSFQRPIPQGTPDDELWRLGTSVLHTGMLPVWEQAPAGKCATNYSALGAPVHQWPPSGGVCWKRINSEAMQACWGMLRHTSATHRPHRRGKPLVVSHYADDVVSGFRRAARLIAPGGGLAEEWQTRAMDLAPLEARLIRRPTVVYMALIHSSLQPQFLESGVDRSIELQVLPSLFGDAASEREIELAAMEQLDVPYFNKPPETPAKDQAAPDANAIGQNGLCDAAWQIGIIRAALQGQITLRQGRLHRADDAQTRGVRRR